MSEQSESPFFPVPVRWFEIPMNTARWGFARLTDAIEANDVVPVASRAASSASSEYSAESVPSANVGKLLNEHA